jgi:hypothetical protein
MSEEIKMEEIKVKYSNKKIWIIFIFSFAVIGLGVLILVNTPFVLLGWYIILIITAAMLLYIWHLKNYHPRLIINNQGVYDLTLKVGMIPWHDIQNAYIRKNFFQTFICLELKNTEYYLSKLNPLMKKAVKVNVKFGFTPLSINLSGLSADADQILDVVLNMSVAKK